MLQEQQDDVLQEQQDEHEQELELAKASWPMSLSSSISKVAVSSSWISIPRSSMILFLPLCSEKRFYLPQPVLVLVEQQEDVEQEQHDEQEQDEEHQPGAS